MNEGRLQPSLTSRHAALCLAACGLLCLLSPVRAEEPKGDGKRVVKDKITAQVVIDDPDREPRVFVWNEEGPAPMKRAMFIGRGFIGAQLIDLTPELREHFGVDPERGLLVARIEPDSPAAKAGLEVGDLVVAIEGEGMADMGDVLEQIRRRKEGDEVKMDVVRDGRPRTLDLTIAERDHQRVELMALPRLPEFDENMIGPAMDRAKRIMDDPAFQDRIKVFRSREDDLEKRLKGLEERLLELQKLLEKKGGR